MTTVIGPRGTAPKNGCMARRSLIAIFIAGLLCAASAEAQQAPASTPLWQVHVKNTTRVEAWRFFEPLPGGGDPRYVFAANRLYGSLDLRTRRIDVTTGVQYVQFGHLPLHASGPGALGTGPQYFDQGGSTTSHGIYLRTLSARVKDPMHGLTLQAGRFGYASGAESPSGDANIEAVKRLRVDSRLVGEFEWSLYQRSFDGVRADLDRARWHAAGAWVIPTQGGFENEAGRSLRRVHVAVANVSAKPGLIAGHTDVQAFVIRYDDTRPVAARPDNAGRPASAVDVHITSTGATAVGVYPVSNGRVDALGWVVAQSGDWYGQSHAAVAVAAEGGFQLTKAHGRPWLRGGWFRSTGDTDPADGKHGTFFQVIPTARRYSLSTTWNLMNLSETFAQAIVKPATKLTARADVHRLHLTRATDLWYAGSGAIQRTGSTFGFAGRRSNGSTDLGTMTEAAADWTISPHVSLNGYIGYLRGGAVVTGTFAGDTLRFGYVESVLGF